MSYIYYSPEKFGLIPVAEINYSDGCYQFDLRVVWRREADGVLLTARDSGCSCPAPFESHGISDLDPVDIEALERECRDEHRDTTAEERQRFLSEVREAMKVTAS